VIVEEMNMYLDTPRDLVDNVYEEVLYGDQPLGWMVLGRKEAIRAAQRETFLDYLGRWYKPERMVVGLGGNIEGDFMSQLEGLLGDLHGNGDGGPPPLKPVDADHVRVKLHTKDSDQAHLCLGVLSYPLTHPDRYALQLLAVVLGGGMSSRLFTEVRERRGLAYYVFGTNFSYTDTGTLYSQAGVDLNRIDDAVSTIAAELKKMADEPVPSDELEKARSFAKGRFVLQTESPQGLIQFGLRREVLEGGAVEPQEVLDGLDAVTAEDVQRVAQDVIGRNELTLAVVGPFDDPDRFEKLLEG
jgi:predicted Zn-dependent peptidase